MSTKLFNFFARSINLRNATEDLNAFASELINYMEDCCEDAVRVKTERLNDLGLKGALFTFEYDLDENGESPVNEKEWAKFITLTDKWVKASAKNWGRDFYLERQKYKVRNTTLLVASYSLDHLDSNDNTLSTLHFDFIIDLNQGSDQACLQLLYEK